MTACPTCGKGGGGEVTHLCAHHPDRAEREPITYAKFDCVDCAGKWTIAVIEGELPKDADRCRCGSPGILMGRS